MLYTLRQLEIFLMTAREQNISHAAKRLHMSQSAASAALLQLEKQFDVSLFDRHGKSLSLSRTGESILAKAQNLLDLADELEDMLHGHNDASHLNIGASLTIGNYLGVKYYSQYLAQFPKTNTKFHIGNSPEILEKVLNFEIDIGLVESEVHHPDLQLIPWREDNLVVFCSPRHPLAKKAVLSNQDLRQADWILREANSGTRQTFDRAMQGLLPDLNILLELEHNEAIKRAVEAQIGIGCLSEIALASNFKHGDLVPLKLNKRKFNRTFYFVLNRHRPQTQAVERWINLCST